MAAKLAEIVEFAFPRLSVLTIDLELGLEVDQLATRSDAQSAIREPTPIGASCSVSRRSRVRGDEALRPRPRGAGGRAA